MTLEQQHLQSTRRLDVAARSRLGAGLVMRSENQDNFLLIEGDGMAHFLLGQRPRSVPVPDWPAGHVRCAVLDGMGGHGHGREAAEAVVAGLFEIPAATDPDTLAAQLDVLHARLQTGFAAGADPERRPGTTLTMLDIPPTGPAVLYHCGDSRLYRIDAGKAEPLTVDHVPATTFAMEGLIGEREWWRQVHGEHRPQISQAFILGNAFEDPLFLADPLHALTAAELPPFLRHLPDRRLIDLQPGAVYLLATDGFWSCADPLALVGEWPALFATRPTAEGVLDALFDTMTAYPPGFLHPDNLTAIAIRPLGG